MLNSGRSGSSLTNVTPLAVGVRHSKSGVADGSVELQPESAVVAAANNGARHLTRRIGERVLLSSVSLRNRRRGSHTPHHVLADPRSLRRPLLNRSSIVDTTVESTDCGFGGGLFEGGERAHRQPVFHLRRVRKGECVAKQVGQYD